MISGKNVTLMGRTKACQGKDPVRQHHPRGAKAQSVLVNASKTRMILFRKQWEQNLEQGCLRGSLSGNGQKLLSARIPAPGGDE